MVDEVDVVVLGADLVHPVPDGPGELGVGLQPGSVEAERERGPVGGVVPLQVVLEERLELLLGVDVGTGGDEGATGQGLVEAGVLTTVELVDGQLPDLEENPQLFSTVPNRGLLNYE